jgi:hypothetical protein
VAAARKKTGGRPRPRPGRVTESPKAARPAAKPSGSRGGAGVGQPGRRPSRPGLLLLVALMWITVGVVVLTSVSASWRIVPGIVAIGFGLLFLRGAAATVARRSAPRR